MLSLPRVIEPKLDPPLHILGQIQPPHILQRLIHQLPILGLRSGGGREDVPDLPYQQGEHEHAHQPREGHEHVLDLLGGLGILADGGGRFGREIKTFYVGVTLAVKHEIIAADSFPGGKGVVGACVQVDQIHHVHERPSYPYCVRIRQQFVHEAEEFPEGVHFEEPGEPQDDEFRSQNEVEQI